MRVLYFDCFSGISGDMVLGALMDLGVDEEAFRRELAKLNLSGYNIVIEKKLKNAISVTDVNVILEDDELEHGYSNDLNNGHDHNHGHNHSHNHDHDHSHHHDHNHDYDHNNNHNSHNHNHGYNQEHNHDHNHSHAHSHKSRNLIDIERIIDSSDLNNNIKQFSKKVFREIAMAEAKVHNKPVEEVHFHEVGAVDSIVDIVGAAICLDLLNIDRVYSSPLHDGKGFVNCQHGRLPVPVPAVMEMLTGSNIPYVVEDINTELVTPTGIGIIKCLAHSFGDMPIMSIERVGYGAGKRDIGRLNALRSIVGTVNEKANGNKVIVLSTNIDDMNPEILGFVMDKLFEAGALDVYYTPVYMKKNRPAVELTVLTDGDKEQTLVDIILKETTTLGIRKNFADRYKMDRDIVKVSTQYGEVRVKVSKLGEFKKFAPEYEDCRAIALNKNVPLWKVYNEIYEKGI